MQGRQGALNVKGAQQIVEHRVRRNVGKNEAKGSAKHRAIGRDRGVWKAKRAAKVKKKISDFQSRRTRNRMTLAPTPRAIGDPTSLVVHTSGKPAAEGKLARHSRREAEMAR